MHYDFSVALPANTAKAAPVVQDLALSPGIIHRVEVVFPDKCAGLAHMTILHKSRQVWPANPDGSYNTNNETVGWDEWHELEEEPYLLQACAWNLDDTYPHTIELRFAILPREILRPPREELTILNRLQRLIFGGA